MKYFDFYKYPFRFCFLLVCLISPFASSNFELDLEYIEQIYIIGTKKDARELTGSGTVISNEDLNKLIDTDIQKVLLIVPGLYFRSEEGFGLRPNISIRGTAPDRSGKITIMEDGVPIAPAPYTAPAAYYFPTVGRIHAVEVLKGPAAISQGPSNIGGVINLISTPIPEDHTGRFVQEYGDDGYHRNHSYAGFSRNNLGFIFEVHENKADGFDTVEHLGGNTGFDRADYLAKIKLNSSRGTDSYHEAVLKLKTSDEISNQTYIGLTQSDYKINPRQRYGLSYFDEMNNQHDSVQLNYLFEYKDFILRATYFDNEFSRDWFKVEKINGQSINDVLRDANRGNVTAQGILHNTYPSEIILKHNNRNYYSSGFNFAAEIDFSLHTLTLGYRDMKDAEDRLQSYESFNQFGDGTYSQPNAAFVPTGADNSKRETKAQSFYVEDKIDFEKLMLSIGFRSEDYSRSEIRWSNILRNKVFYQPESKNGNYNLWGFGATYEISNHTNFIFGFHEGRSPVFGDDAEAADNLELGVRFDNGDADFEFFYFSSDYSNLVAECKNSDGGNCEIGDSFSGGAVDVDGYEVNGSTIFQLHNLSFPVAFQYTKTNSKFQNSFESEYFGTVSSGDNVPYLPSSSIAIVAGFLLSSGMEGNFRLARIGKTCSTAACGEFNIIDSYTLVDFSLKKSLSKDLVIYGIIENILNETNIVARSPQEGIRTQKPRSLKLGVEYRF
ncbi:MAG: TonB-dependent receptor [Gammaproteobacteria bacterium]